MVADPVLQDARVAWEHKTRRCKTMNSNVNTQGRIVLGLFLLLACLAASPSPAQNTLQWIGNFRAINISEDGTVVAGTSADGIFDAIRWTEENGMVNLGMSSGQVLGRGGGVTGMSADGERVAYTTITEDSLYVTSSLWTKGEGWQEVMPPPPPGGGVFDGGYGATWGLSGDGNTVVGLFWLPGNGGDSAHAFSWTEAEGIIDLGSNGYSSRANNTNHDGSVVVGWAGSAIGAWQPAVWENGTMTIVSATTVSCMLSGVTRDGNILLGKDYNEDSEFIEASFWSRTDSGWQVQHLGVLPGTYIGSGQSHAEEATANGSVIVGSNRLVNNIFAGFVWTFEQGIVHANDYVESLGIDLPAGFTINSMNDITDDGRFIAGYGTHYETPGYPESFIISIPHPSPVPEAQVSAQMTLGPNYPNPFNPNTSIALSLERGGEVQVDLFDARGRFVRSLHEGHLAAGSHNLVWDGMNSSGAPVGSGVYLARARLETGEVQTIRMTLVK